MTGVFADALMDTIKAAGLLAVAAVVYAAAMMAIFKAHSNHNKRKRTHKHRAGAGTSAERSRT